MYVFSHPNLSVLNLTTTCFFQTSFVELGERSSLCHHTAPHRSARHTLGHFYHKCSDTSNLIISYAYWTLAGAKEKKEDHVSKNYINWDPRKLFDFLHVLPFSPGRFLNILRRSAPRCATTIHI